MCKIKNDIFYNNFNEFFVLLNEGKCWIKPQNKVFLLRKVADNQIYVIPEHIFHMDFINMKKEHVTLHFKRLGWSEFEMKKLEKNYAQLLKNNKNLSSQ